MSIIEQTAWLGNHPVAAIVLALVALCGIACESLRGRQ